MALCWSGLSKGAELVEWVDILKENLLDWIIQYDPGSPTEAVSLEKLGIE